MMEALRSSETSIIRATRRNFPEDIILDMSFIWHRMTLAQIFSEYFGFPYHPFIPLIAPQSSPSIIHGWWTWFHSSPTVITVYHPRLVDLVPLQPHR
jgi:hypothetical protein